LQEEKQSKTKELSKYVTDKTSDTEQDNLSNISINFTR